MSTICPKCTPLFFFLVNFLILLVQNHNDNLKQVRNARATISKDSVFNENIQKDLIQIPDFVFNEKILTVKDIHTLIEFTDKVVSNIHENLPTPYYEEIQKIITNNKQCGLTNFNGYCFINTVIQILFSSKHFINEINMRRSHSVFFRELSNLFRLMGKSKVVNQIRFLIRLYEEYDLTFDFFRKKGKISDVIQTISGICTNEGCSIFDFEANQELCQKFPIIRSFGDVEMKMKVEFANVLIDNLKDNKILIFSGNMKKNSTTCVLRETGNIVEIGGKKYKLFGIIEKTETPSFHAQAHALRNGKWYLFNDECVTETHQETILHSIEPYFAFYEQM